MRSPVYGQSPVNPATEGKNRDRQRYWKDKLMVCGVVQRNETEMTNAVVEVSCFRQLPDSYCAWG